MTNVVEVAANNSVGASTSLAADASVTKPADSADPPGAATVDGAGGDDLPPHALDVACDALAALGAGTTTSALGLKDTEANCRTWAVAGECMTNAAFMLDQCQLSCLRRICHFADYEYDAAVDSGSHNALLASVHRSLAESGPVIADEHCEVDPGVDNYDIMARMINALGEGIPGDAGCALSKKSILHEAVRKGGGISKNAAMPLEDKGLDLLRTDVKDAPGALANATHVYMDTVCFSRGRVREAMTAVSMAPDLRCMAVFKKPIPLRQLKRGGLSLMCWVSNGDETFTSRSPLFVYAKANSTTMQKVWPNKVPECDRSDLDGPEQMTAPGRGVVREEFLRSSQVMQ